MSWPVRSKLLMAEVVAAPGANTKRWSAAVPAGKTWLWKDTRFFNNGGAACDFLTLVEIGGVAYVVGQELAVGAGKFKGGSGGSIVLPAGSRIGYQVSVNQSVQVVFSGAQLG